MKANYKNLKQIQITKIPNYLVDKVLHTVEKYKLLEDGDRVLVAVSGGPDSMFLLWVLNAIKDMYFSRQPQGLPLRVAHLNHGIRESAREEAEFVREQAKRFGIPCSIEERDVRSYARARKISLEEGARELRYEFLEGVAEKFGMNKIAVGHTLSDEVETFILRVARGAGGRGLLLIPPKREVRSQRSEARGQRVEVIRPLIETTREEIKRFLDKEGIRYCVDESNYDFSYKRNFVRHKVVPSLIELAPYFPEKVMRLREILEDEEEVLERIARERLKEIRLEAESGKPKAETGKRELVIDLKGFLDSPLAIKRRMLREIMKSEIRNLKYPGFEEIENAIKFIENSRGGKELDLKGIKIIKSGGEIKISNSPDKVGTGSIRNPKYCVELGVPGEVEVNGIKIRSEVRSQRPEVRRYDDGKRVYFDFDKIKLPLLVRGMKDGDRMKIKSEFFRQSRDRLHLKSEIKVCEKKLKDVFIDDKVPVWERRRIPLVVDGEGILWIVGMRRAYRGLIEKDTREVLEVWVE